MNIRYDTILRSLYLKLSLKIRDHELECIERTTYLGLQINISLDWKYHICILSSNVSKAQAHRHWGQGALPPNNSPKLYIEALCAVLLNRFLIDTYPI